MKTHAIKLMKSEANLISLYTYILGKETGVHVRMPCYFELPNTATTCSLQRLLGCLKTAGWEVLKDNVTKMSCPISSVKCFYCLM